VRRSNGSNTEGLIIIRIRLSLIWASTVYRTDHTICNRREVVKKPSSPIQSLCERLELRNPPAGFLLITDPYPPRVSTHTIAFLINFCTTVLHIRSHPNPGSRARTGARRILPSKATVTSRATHDVLWVSEHFHVFSALPSSWLSRTHFLARHVPRSPSYIQPAL
jgi:hypothetical protein